MILNTEWWGAILIAETGEDEAVLAYLGKNTTSGGRGDMNIYEEGEIKLILGEGEGFIKLELHR